MIEIEEYFCSEKKEYWLEQIKKSDWGAGGFLYSLLSDNKLRQMCGEKTVVLMLTDNDQLLAFCTLAEQDDIQPTELTPWIGFVYTYPECRGHHYAGKLLCYAEELAQKDGMEYVYVSTNHTGLYEKYGYEYWKMLPDVGGEDSRVYRKKL